MQSALFVALAATVAGCGGRGLRSAEDAAAPTSDAPFHPFMSNPDVDEPAEQAGDSGADGPAAVGEAAAGAAGAGGGEAAAGAGGSGGGQPDAAMPAPDGAAGADALPFEDATLPNGRCVQGAFPRNGVCTCQPDTPDVCTAHCTDIKLDDDNCGGCGRVCASGATCNGGACGPVPVSILPVVPGCLSLHLAVGGGKLYVADKGHGTIQSLPVVGGAATTIAPHEMAPTTLVLRGTTLFWLDEGSRTIRKSVASGAPTDVVASPTDIDGFTVTPDASAVFFSTATKVRKAPAAGGPAIDVASEEHGGLPGALALDGNLLATPTGLNGDVDVVTLTDGVVVSCGKLDPISGELLPTPGCLRVARSQGSLNLSVIIERPNRVFWLDGASVKGNDTGPGATASNDTIANAMGDVTTMGASTTALYFAEDGLVERTPFAPNSIPVRLARGQKSPTSIAVDTARVFWSTSDCAINATNP
jgi:hypothetical protein